MRDHASIIRSINPVDNPGETLRHSMKGKDGQPERREDSKQRLEMSCRYSNRRELRKLLNQVLEVVDPGASMSLLRAAGRTPGIDEAHAEIPEVTDVAGRDGCFPG